jgi:hypothetical protein
MESDNQDNNTEEGCEIISTDDLLDKVEDSSQDLFVKIITEVSGSRVSSEDPYLVTKEEDGGLILVNKKYNVVRYLIGNIKDLVGFIIYTPPVSRK